MIAARALARELEFQSTPDYADAYLGWAETVPHPSHELFWRTVTYERALHNHENKEQQ